MARRVDDEGHERWSGVLVLVDLLSGRRKAFVRRMKWRPGYRAATHRRRNREANRAGTVSRHGQAKCHLRWRVLRKRRAGDNGPELSAHSRPAVRGSFSARDEGVGERH